MTVHMGYHIRMKQACRTLILACYCCVARGEGCEGADRSRARSKWSGEPAGGQQATGGQGESLQTGARCPAVPDLVHMLNSD